MYLNMYDKFILTNNNILKKIKSFYASSNHFFQLNNDYILVSGSVSFFEFEKARLNSMFLNLFLNVEGVLLKIKVVIDFLSLNVESQLYNEMFVKDNLLIVLIRRDAIDFTASIVFSEMDCLNYLNESIVTLTPLNLLNRKKEEKDWIFK